MPRPKRLTSLFARGRPAAGRVQAAYATEPQPLPGSGREYDGPWSRFITSLVYDLELALLWGVLIALSAWFVFSTRPAIETGEVELLPAGHQPIVGSPPAGQFQLVSAAAREQLILAIVSNEPTKPALNFAPIEQQAFVAQPKVDPLGFVIVTGLPADSRLSAGAKLAETGDWAVPFGDLDNLVIELPRDRAGAIRTQLELKTRDGLKITTLTVEIRERRAEPKASRNYNRPTAVKAPAPVKAKTRPTKVTPLPVKGGKTLDSKAVKAPVVKPPPVYPGDPPPGPPGAKVVKPPTPFLALPAPGLFTPSPKSAASGDPEVKDDPRFTTLKGLGMAPEEISAPPVAGSVP